MRATWSPKWGAGSIPFRAWVLLGAMVLAFGCAAPGAPRPEAPTLTGEDPAVGQPFSLDLVEAGQPLRLEGVPGRVTLVCVLQEEPWRIVRACEDQQERWRDRVAAVGLATNGQLLDPAALPFRVYLDPQGDELSSLGIGPYSQVIVVDVRGRVAEAIPLSGIDTLEQTVTRLVP